MPVDGASEGERASTGILNIDDDRFLQLLSRVENLEKRDKDQQAEIHTLRSELNNEKQRTSRLEPKLSWLTMNYGKCRNTACVTKPADSEAFHKQKNEAIQAPQTKQTGETNSRARRQEQLIALFATLEHTTTHAGVHQSIVFDTVQTTLEARIMNTLALLLRLWLACTFSQRQLWCTTMPIYPARW